MNNNQPRYQIFVSSTFRDLIDERQAALDAILELHHFPAGMETFPASNSTPWGIIERIINESDYYVLIVGGRYGTTDENGISYTEREYDLAIQLNKPVLAFLHGAPDEIPSGKTEMDPAPRAMLANFRAKVGKHHVKYWKNKDELKSQVIVGLIDAFNSYPSPGWVRASGYNNQELLSKLVMLQQRFDEILAENELLQSKIDRQLVSEDISRGDEIITISFKYYGNGGEVSSTLDMSWDQVFFLLGDALMSPKTTGDLQWVLFQHLLEEFKKTNTYTELYSGSIKPDQRKEQIEETSPQCEVILRQFLALGLVEVIDVHRDANSLGFTLSNTGSFVTHWKLSFEGTSKFLNRVAVRNRQINV